MDAGKTIVIVGVAMFAVGLAMFYSVETGQADPAMRLVKSAGTFAGLSGIGVTMAGILLYLIGKSEMPVQSN